MGRLVPVRLEAYNSLHGQRLEGIASGYWTLSVKQPSGLSATRVRVPCPPRLLGAIYVLDKGLRRVILKVTDSVQ